MKLNFLILSTFLFLVSCQEREQAKTSDCAQFVGLQQTSLMGVPQLNVQPVYLEMRAAWETTHAPDIKSIGNFRMSYGFTGIQSEAILYLKSGNSSAKKCGRQLTLSQYQSLVQLINSASICKAERVEPQSCSVNQMIAPFHLFLIDQNQGEIKVNLSPYSRFADLSFCSEQDVGQIKNLITSFYDQIQPVECIDLQ